MSIAADDDPERDVVLADSVGLALLVVLETLTPAERLAEIKTSIDTAVRLAPDDPEVMLGLGNYYALTGEVAKASELFQRVARLFPNNTDALIALSGVARRESRWADALAELRQARLLDPRSAETKGALSRYLASLRRFADLERLLTEEPITVATTPIERNTAAMIPFQARGETAAMDALVAELAPAARRGEPDALAVCAQWMSRKGDAAGVIRLWEQAGPKWRFSYVTERFDLIAVAAAYLKLGQRERAQPLLEKNRDLLIKQLAEQPDNAIKQNDLALTYAMLGEQRLALAHAAEMARLPAGQQRADYALVHAWAGQKDQAVAELAAALRSPTTPSYYNIHAFRREIMWWPLLGYPAFEALLNDPASNAPLL